MSRGLGQVHVARHGAWGLALVEGQADHAGLEVIAIACGPHVLRHTFCSHLSMRGAPARAVQKLADHRDLGTTQRYMHLSPLAIEAAIRLLELPPSAAERGNMSATPEAGEEVSGTKNKC